jgi:hypothetical protein
VNQLLEDPRFWRIALSLAAAACFYLGFRWWRLARVIDDTPLSRVRSAAQGFVEVSGRGTLPEGSENRAPLSARPCVWWSYKIQHKRQSGKSTTWQTIRSDSSNIPFLLTDESGWCVVNPMGAEVFPGDHSTWYGSTDWPANTGSNGAVLDRLLSDYRYTEYRIYEHERINAIGEFCTMGGIKGVDTESAATELLRQWKQDQSQLLRRFDENSDGVLSRDEWDKARLAARREVETRAQLQAPERYNVLMKPQDDRPFLIASFDLSQLARRYRWRASLALLAFVVLCGVLTDLFTDPRHRP